MENTVPETKKTASYIDRVRLFWKIDAESPFTGSETRLYFFLLEEINRNMWNPVRLSARDIKTRLKMGSTQILKGISNLVKRGLITLCENTKSKRPGSIFSVPDSEQIYSQLGTAAFPIRNGSVPNSEQPDTQSFPIRNGSVPNSEHFCSQLGTPNAPDTSLYSIKTYKDVLEDNNRERITRDANLPVVGVNSALTADEFFARYFAPENSGNIEAWCMNYYTTPEQFKEYCRQIYADWKLSNKMHSSYADASQHLLSIVRQRIAADRKAASAGPRETREQADERLKRKAARDIIEAIRNPYDNDNNDDKPF